ncbi:hypothetical protein OW495_15890, partial [Vibrio sp. 14N.309.X.WAT.E.F5]|nr:hypothetical protein [Vibrio sp. 14N.309.X.WAT.E.F5]
LQLIFRYSGFRRLGKPSSSLKVTFNNGSKSRSFRKTFKKPQIKYYFVTYQQVKFIAFLKQLLDLTG